LRLTERQIKAHWPLTGVSLGDVLQRFDERSVSLVLSREGRFVAKICDQWHSVQEAERHTFVFDFLQEAGFEHVPAILKTKAGRSVQWIDGYPVCILEFIEGAEPPLTRENGRFLGEVTAKLHAIGGYPYDYLFTVADVIPEMVQIAETLSFGRDYGRLVRSLPDFGALPRALIHGEIVGNCLQTPGGRLVAVDWDEAGNGTRVLDLGHPLIQVFLSEDLEWDEPSARGFYEGYFSRMALEEFEIERVFDAGLFYALRYIIYGNTAKRWKRIRFALRNRDMLEAVVRDAWSNGFGRP
jgi:Ser/Thr protein kinase RdoA (MazF antagonist)